MAVDLNVTPAGVNIAGRCGDQWTTTVYFKDANGSVVDMGGTYTAYLRTNIADSGTIASITCGTTNATSGTVTLTMGTAVTAALVAGAQTVWNGYWDLQRNQGSGVVRTLLAGNAKFTLDVTR